MIEVWERPEHRVKVAEAADRARANPVKLAAMRERLARNRLKSLDERGAAISDAYFLKYHWGGFTTNAALTDWIVAQYQAGLATARQIALAIGMSHNAVCDRLRAAGIDLPPRGCGQRQPALSATHLAKRGYEINDFDRQIASLYRDGASVYALSKAYGVGDQVIRTSLYRSDVVLRGKGGRPSKIPRWRPPKRR
jgi:hypothetical protein